MALRYTKAEKISLKQFYNENWLRDRIKDIYGHLTREK
jgi:hypothetical protein